MEAIELLYRENLPQKVEDLSGETITQYVQQVVSVLDMINMDAIRTALSTLDLK